MKPFTFAAPALLLAVVPVLAAGGRAPENSVSFEKDVWPIFEDRCMTCHGSMNMGKLRLDSKERLLKGGEDGAVIVAGKPDESLLYRRIMLPADDFDIMPAEGEPLTDDQKETIRLWIAGGAEFGDWTAAAE